jgi:hypothetical protein
MGMPFIENRGQTAEPVRFYAPGPAGSVFLTRDGQIAYSLFDGRLSLSERPVGRLSPKIRAERRAPTRVSYLRGNDSSCWKTDIPTYDVVSLGEVFDGIRLDLRIQAGAVEKLFRVAPGADPASIRMSLSGGQSLRVDESGALEIVTSEGPVRLTAPIAFQEEGGGHRPVEVAYWASGDRYGFRVGEYDAKKELVIDPILAATFLGGTEAEFGEDRASGMARDGSGNVLVTGGTEAPDFPGIGVQGTPADGVLSGGQEAYVAKLTPDLGTILAATFLGGSEDDVGLDVTVDGSGDVYVSGRTDSADLPGIGAGSPDSTLVFAEGFVVKLNSDLTAISAGTFLGGGGSDNAISIALDGVGHLFVTGIAGGDSDDFPGVTVSSADSSFDGPQEAFVARLNLDLSSLLATFLGGDNDEVGRDLAVNGAGEVFVAGDTQSTDFPGIGAQGSPADGVCANCADAGDGFVAKLSSNLSAILAATFLGGTDGDSANAIVLDGAGNPYVAGSTSAEDFPGIGVQGAAADGVCDCAMSGDGFVARLNPALTAILAATYVGGSSGDQADAVTLDGSGNPYVAGSTGSADFPGVGAGASDPTQALGEGFVVRLDSGLTSFLAGTFLGGSALDSARAIVLDGDDNVFVAGGTESADFPGIGPDSADADFQGDREGFVAKLDPDLSDNPPDCSTAAPSVPVIWEPSHGLIAIQILGVTDPDGDPVTITIDSIRQDEPVVGAGTGAFCPDGSGVGTSTAFVRAERAGTRDGRIYTIAFTASDGSGPTCFGVVTVCVSRDQKGIPVCGNQGPLFDSTVCP